MIIFTIKQQGLIYSKKRTTLATEKGNKTGKINLSPGKNCFQIPFLPSKGYMNAVMVALIPTHNKPTLLPYKSIMDRLSQVYQTYFIKKPSADSWRPCCKKLLESQSQRFLQLYNLLFQDYSSLQIKPYL